MKPIKPNDLQGVMFDYINKHSKKGGYFLRKKICYRMSMNIRAYITVRLD